MSFLIRTGLTFVVSVKGNVIFDPNFGTFSDFDKKECVFKSKLVKIFVFRVKGLMCLIQTCLICWFS